ncbi:MAG: hypothetical protein AMXMBFR64_34700 [Myxococcales bacterium]
MSMRGAWLGIVAAGLLVGCVQHIGDYEPKRRQYKSPVDFQLIEGPLHNGSLFNPNHPGSFLFADQRAMYLGDLVTVRIKEVADAKRAATTKLSRESNVNFQISAFFTLLEQIDPDLTKKNMLNAMFSNGFDGMGQTARTEHFEATVPSIVREVLPNGNLFIEGQRVILVNLEEHHFYISGVIRPVDIQGDNSIESSLIADAEIEFTGRGVISEKQSPGWLSRALDYASPF